MFCSIARLPVVRGVRPRRYKIPIQHTSSIRKSVMISDEENTSEYSHSPSSQHSTLESNPDMPEVIKKMNNNRSQLNVDGNEDDDESSSDSESEEISDITSVQKVVTSKFNGNDEVGVHKRETVV